MAHSFALGAFSLPLNSIYRAAQAAITCAHNTIPSTIGVFVESVAMGVSG